MVNNIGAVIIHFNIKKELIEMNFFNCLSVKEVEILLNSVTVGYGFNTVGAFDRDGSLSSYDYQFATEQEAVAEQESITEYGYGDTLYGICRVSLLDEVEAHASSIYQADEDLQGIEGYNQAFAEALESELQNLRRFGA